MVYTISGYDAFFREDYRSEVQSIFSLMYSYEHLTVKPIPVDDYPALRSLLTDHPESWKRLLQHIYTHDPEIGPKMYGEIKEAVFLFERKGGTDPVKRKQLLEKFMLQYYRLERLQTRLTAPNFGACDYCVKHMGKFPKVKKHKKFLKKADPKMWDLFSQ